MQSYCQHYIDMLFCSLRPLAWPSAQACCRSQMPPHAYGLPCPTGHPEPMPLLIVQHTIAVIVKVVAVYEGWSHTLALCPHSTSEPWSPGTPLSSRPLPRCPGTGADYGARGCLGSASAGGWCLWRSTCRGGAGSCIGVEGVMGDGYVGACMPAKV